MRLFSGRPPRLFPSLREYKMKCRSTPILIVLILLCLVLPVTRTAAETPAPELGADVAGIRSALDRLVVLMETVQHQQRVDLVLKRIELRERRLAPLEQRLQDAHSDVETMEGELVQMRAMREQFEAQLDELSKTRDMDENERNQIREFERVEAAIEARTDEAQLRVRRYEDELADGREEIEILDEMLLELLDLK